MAARPPLTVALMRVDADEFLSRLEKLFAEAKEKHSVFVTVKRIARGSDGVAPQPDGAASVLFRATDGKSTERTKISTVVAPDHMLAFRDAYGALLRAQLAEMLKKRDKAKERRVDKLLIASRKKLEENGGRVLIRGASTWLLLTAERGAGRRQRMRARQRAQKLRVQRHAQAAL
ncbi:hypothetical protein MCAP1_000537 [Malassezia caprae]|uniref:Signal recognition particle subunit SRP14 n=1 Tax=Malassezia caprae TaxID=1381934 RepID=A0AAF0IU35_9BASI|nr:hypothetical protein MCAP1_000537 [Malassezia caprae]